MARILALTLVASLALGGAAAAKPKPGPHAPTHAKAKPAPGDDAGPARPSRPSDASPSLPLAGLLSANEAEARAKLGPPDLARTEGSGAMWTYRLPDCALFVFFKAAEGQSLKVSGAATGPRRRGQPPTPVDACVAQALAQASHGLS